MQAMSSTSPTAAMSTTSAGLTSPTSWSAMGSRRTRQPVLVSGWAAAMRSAIADISACARREPDPRRPAAEPHPAWLRWARSSGGSAAGTQRSVFSAKPSRSAARRRAGR